MGRGVEDLSSMVAQAKCFAKQCRMGSNPLARTIGPQENRTGVEEA